MAEVKELLELSKSIKSRSKELEELVNEFKTKCDNCYHGFDVPRVAYDYSKNAKHWGEAYLIDNPNIRADIGDNPVLSYYTPEEFKKECSDMIPWYITDDELELIYNIYDFDTIVDDLSSSDPTKTIENCLAYRRLMKFKK